jgi:membrane protein YqaA with SNARE-associated domain
MLIDPIETRVEEAAEKARGLLRSRYGLWALASISFFESALLVPILTDPFLVAYILADRHSAKKGVIVTTIASMLGGIFAYLVALSFYEFIAEQYLVGTVGEQFYTIVDGFKEGTFALTILGAVTPVPYTLVAMAAGFVHGSFIAFCIASFLGRGFRYGVVGWLTHRFGNKALVIARENLLYVTIVFFVGAFLYMYLK